MNNSTEKFTPTTDWMAEKYFELNMDLFDGELGNCTFNIFTTGKGSEGHTLGRFRITGRGVKYNRTTRRMYVVQDWDKVFINYDNFDSLCMPCIELNGNYKRSEQMWLTTLAHEMCHYYTYMFGRVPGKSHGSEFMNIGRIITEKSNGKFTIQRLASSEEMADAELDAKLVAKRKNREDNKKSKLAAVLVLRKRGETQLITTSSNKLIDEIKTKNNRLICDKILISRDPGFIQYLWDQHYKHDMRSYRYWQLQDSTIPNEIKKYDYDVMVDYTNEVNETIQLTLEDVSNIVENAVKEIIKNNYEGDEDITPNMILSNESPLEK